MISSRVIPRGLRKGDGGEGKENEDSVFHDSVCSPEFLVESCFWEMIHSAAAALAKMLSHRQPT